jgi:hypothetical protein
MRNAALAAMAVAMIVPMAAGTAQAADLTPTEIVNRHIGAKGDIDAIMADYADDAVVLQSGKAFQGKAAIRPLFERMFPKRPAGAAPAAKPAGGGMKVTRIWEEGNVGFITWEAGPMKATEEFIVRDGKIQTQVIFMSAAPSAPPVAPAK